MAIAGKAARSLPGWTSRIDGWVYQVRSPLLRDSQMSLSALSSCPEYVGFSEATDLLRQSGTYYSLPAYEGQQVA
jgi:hypothetical protein